MKNEINSTTISVRDLEESDIPYVVNYWFHSPKGFIEAMGADPGKMGSAEQMESGLRKKVQQNSALPRSQINALAITYKREPIGFHVLNPLVENDHGIFHAHIWEPAMRNKGIGLHSYPQALRVFMDRFHLNRILFKTPQQNIGAIRVKEKLGIRCLGEEIIDFGIIKDGTIAKVFELTREEAQGFPPILS